MPSKQELIDYCKANNIFYRASWKKEQIQENINAGVKFGDLIECVCPRSGLKFWVEIENKREGLIEPDISYYTSHPDTSVRYPAIAAIERGKAEGWTTWNQFKEAIHAALNPPLPPPIEYHFEGKWAAKIVGADVQYRFERKFLNAVETGLAGDRKRFFFPEDGYYECCYKSRSDNETRYYYKVESGKVETIALEDLDIVFPEVLSTPDLATESTKEYLGKEKDLIQHKGKLKVIVRVDTSYKREEVWDDEEDEYTWQTIAYHVTHLRSATSEETAQFNAEIAAKQARKERVEQLKALGEQLFSDDQRKIIPTKWDYYPSGKEFVLSMGYYQANDLYCLENNSNRFWSLTYNGRDGDMWSLNNVAGAYIGVYVELTEAEQQQIEELLNCLNS